MTIDATFAESTVQPCIAGMHLDPRSHNDENGDPTSHVVITDTHGHVLGAVGQIKRVGAPGAFYFARPYEGARWVGPFKNSVDAMSATAIAFRQTVFGSRTEKVVHEYNRGLITRVERDAELARLMADYATFAQAGKVFIA